MSDSRKNDTSQQQNDSVVDRRRDNGERISGLERRRGPGRRRSDFARSAEEGEMTSEQFLFVAAIDAFKQANNKTFPAWTDVLEVIRLLGYRKTQPSELGLRNLEDWLEKPDTPANVRTISAYEENHDDLAA
ncbi:MAG: hypothetical protein ACYTF7_09755 [Planctomycetota bacterium]|jgi:hypothetical protein